MVYDTKYGRETSARPFLKKIKFEIISGWLVWNVIKFAFIVCLSRRLPKYIKTKLLNTCFDLI